MVKRLGLLAAAILVLGLSDAFATWQQPDILIYKGSMYRIYSEPMEAYFEANPSKRPTVCERNSSLWRGYVATMIVVNSELILKDINIPTAPGNGDPWCQKESVLERVAADGKPLKLNWISGFLVSFDGSNHGDSYSFEFLETFERYSVFEFTSGNLATATSFQQRIQEFPHPPIQCV